MSIARIDGGSVIEVRDIELADVPDHKRHLWRDVIGSPPSIDAAYQTITAQDYVIAGDFVERVWVVETTPVETVKVSAIAELNSFAGSERAKILTTTPGMSEVYERKRREAFEIIDIETPDPASYPLVKASIIDTETPTVQRLKAEATLILSKDMETAPALAAIERVRRIALDQIEQATTAEQVRSAINNAVWP